MNRSKISVDANRGAVDIEGTEEFIKQNLELFRQITSDVLTAYKSAPSTREQPLLHKSRSTEINASTQELTTEGLQEFLQQRELRSSEMEYATVFVYYLRVVLKYPAVSYDDIEECYRLIGRPVPQIRNAVNNAAHRRKWLERDKKGMVDCTRVGRNFVEHPPSRTKSSSSRSVKNHGKESDRKSASSPPALRVKGELDLYGKSGNSSVKDFLGNWSGESNVDRIAVAAYYLSEVLGAGEFDEHDVFTVFDHMRWKPPTYMKNNIYNHARSHGFYDTSAEGRFRTTLKLKIHVEHDLGFNRK